MYPVEETLTMRLMRWLRNRRLVSRKCERWLQRQPGNLGGERRARLLDAVLGLDDCAVGSGDGAELRQRHHARAVDENVNVNIGGD